MVMTATTWAAMRLALAAAILAAGGCSAGLPSPEAPRPAPSPGAEPAPAAQQPFEPLLPPVVAVAEPPPPARDPDPPAPPPEVPADLRAPPPGARRTTSGLVYRVLQKGTGAAHPQPRSVVEVHYTGWTEDGRMFDSSLARGQTMTFPLDRVIRGWTEGLQLMVAGEKARFWIPSSLAYGDRPQGGAPAGPLVFDVELIDIKSSDTR
jgi:FKBP-type peptidyl-prolyl cis-trans isomerase